MQLDQITANIRLRSSWEAVDLGFAMVQRWWRSIYPPLLLFNLSILLLAFLFVPTKYYLYVMLFFWWIKPYSHRLILHILSQRLFNNDLSTWQALKDIPSIFRGNTFGAITFRRFSFSRGFNLPIWQLEGIRGKARAKRQTVLLNAVHSEAIWLTIGLFFIEIILTFSLLGLFLLFVPESHFDSFTSNFFNPELGSIETWVMLFISSLYIVITLIIEPFYIAANFALYINRRTQLEAWDIELSFRKMAIRLATEKEKLATLAKGT
ncbi:MAG: hypothetical protein KAH03_05550 [Cocleimonas sp.]|nr:hypothetical protein [Cocleimonas sp.]